MTAQVLSIAGSQHHRHLSATAKRCKRCSEVKASEQFAKNRATPDGLQGWCRDCYREYGSERKTMEDVGIAFCKLCLGYDNANRMTGDPEVVDCGQHSMIPGDLVDVVAHARDWCDRRKITLTLTYLPEKAAFEARAGSSRGVSAADACEAVMRACVNAERKELRKLPTTGEMP